MKIGILSDIHSNAEALRAVLNSARKHKVEKILCCGDYIGYYYEPEQVLNLLDEWDWTGISGNHEAMLLDWENISKRRAIMSKYGSGISIANDNLSKFQLKRLKDMPNKLSLIIENKRITLCHGSPWNMNEYIYPDSKRDKIKKMFESGSDFDYLFFGHTHYPAIWNMGKRRIVNPGSVGQPRDKIPGACWVLLDTEEDKIRFFREKYDINNLIRMCKKYNPDIKYLVEVLLRS